MSKKTIESISGLLEELITFKQPEKYLRHMLKLICRRVTKQHKDYIYKTMDDLIGKCESEQKDLIEIINDKQHYSEDQIIKAVNDLYKKQEIILNAHKIQFEVFYWESTDRVRDYLRPNAIKQVMKKFQLLTE